MENYLKNIIGFGADTLFSAPPGTANSLASLLSKSSPARTTQAAGMHPVDALAKTQQILFPNANPNISTPDQGPAMVKSLYPNGNVPEIEGVGPAKTSAPTPGTPVPVATGGGSSAAPSSASSFSAKDFDPDKYFDPEGGINKFGQKLSTQDLYAVRAALASRQGDILTRAVNTGIPFNPEQLRTLHESASGLLDPALADINARILHSEKLDEEKAKASASGTGTGLGTAGAYVKGQNPVVDDYVNRINSGQITEDDVATKYLPGVKNTALRNAIFQGLTATRYDNAKTAGDLDTINTIDELLSNKKLSHISGIIDQGLGGLFGKSATAKSQYNQLTGALQLAKAGQIKGQGQISDYERKVLRDASTALNRGLSDAEFRKQLVKIRGVMANASGLESKIKVTDPVSGESQIISADRSGVSQAIRDGLHVEYVE